MMIQICQYVRQREPGEVEHPRGPWSIWRGTWMKSEEELEEEEEEEEEAIEGRQWESDTACSLWEQKTKKQKFEKCNINHSHD